MRSILLVLVVGLAEHCASVGAVGAARHWLAGVHATGPPEAVIARSTHCACGTAIDGACMVRLPMKASRRLQATKRCIQPAMRTARMRQTRRGWAAGC